jgi:hypothetical protein
LLELDEHGATRNDLEQADEFRGVHRELLGAGMLSVKDRRNGIRFTNATGGTATGLGE